MRRAAFLLVLLALVSGQVRPVRARDPGGTPPRQVFLIQDSGWMEPFLTAEGSQFRPLVEALVAAAKVPGGEIAVAAFDQDGQVAGRPSPRTLYDGPYDAARVAAAVAAIDLPRKTGTAIYADADFNGALLGAIRGGLRGRDGVIWMVTNNKNAPGNSPEVEANTAAFDAALRGSDAITRLVAYPVRMPLKGRRFTEGGFVVYGIGYGPAGGRMLDAELTDPALKALFSHPPVSLKPALAGGIDLRFERVDSDGLRAGSENGVLVLRGADAAAGTALRLTARLHNGLYPQRIASARIRLDWSEIGGGGSLARDAGLASAAVTPEAIDGVPPLADGGPLAVTLTLPPIPRPAGLAGLLADRRTVDGVLTLRLSDLRLDLDPAILERVRPIFSGGRLVRDQGGDVPETGESRLPGTFRDLRRASQASATLPVRIEAEFSPWPLLAASAGALALAGAAGVGAMLGTRVRTRTVMLGAFAKQATLRPYRAQTMRAPDGSRWRVVAGFRGPARATRLTEPGPSA